MSPVPANQGTAPAQQQGTAPVAPKRDVIDGPASIRATVRHEVGLDYANYNDFTATALGTTTATVPQLRR
jgi:hypothetical protein